MLHAYTKEQLFHYTTKEIAIEKIFQDMTIKLGSMRATNDPRETDPWFFSMTVKDEKSMPSNEEFFRLNAEIDEILKSSCLIVCLTQDQPDLHPELGDPDKHVRDDLGFQGYEHDRMWAQYAGNHTGICIFFDRKKLTQRIGDHFQGRVGHLLHGPVSYASKLTPYSSPFYELSYDELHRIGVGAYARRHREEFARQLYLTKNPD